MLLEQERNKKIAVAFRIAQHANQKEFTKFLKQK